jgi:signal transduction histidine kinase/ligand-binding sensor domain-containing protein
VPVSGNPILEVVISRVVKRTASLSVAVLFAFSAYALDPHKSLTQYSRTTWGQEDGLPQDTIRAITQTTDGYLWLGTDEGLARFDGYDFRHYDKASGDLPANSITALAAASDGTLWIGTSNGLTQYAPRGKARFRTLTVKDGLPDDAISQLYEDHEGTLWIVAGIYLSRYQNGRFTNFAPGKDLPVTTARIIREDRAHDLWVAGFTAVVKMKGDRFETVMDAHVLEGNIPTAMLFDRQGNFWLGGNLGIMVRSPKGDIRRYTERDGLPDRFIRTLWEDRDGNIWAGTNSGIARMDGDRFVTPNTADANDVDPVRCLFEDREGDMWVGTNGGLTRYRDTVFTAYGKTEGLPSDEPNAIYQDRAGTIWVGFHESGLLRFGPGPPRRYTTRDGLPNNEIFSIREASNGDLLIGARGGMVRMHDGRFTTFVPNDPLERLNVFDAIEDAEKRIWLATPGGLAELTPNGSRTVFTSEPLLVNAVVTLCADRDGSVWAGTYGKGLWRVNGKGTRQFTVSDGLSSDQIRSLYQDDEGTLWIATFGGGLDAYRDGKFQAFTARDGLLSDNVARVSDDGDSLWLSTTRGICRIAKRQLSDFAAHRRPRLEPVNYGTDDGLRSAQCSPSYPIGGGGTRTTDGRLWFTTMRGLAVFSPGSHGQPSLAPVVHVADIEANGHPVDLSQPARLAPSNERVQIRYAAIHLNAPERVQYFYRLDGIDKDWVSAGTRRLINYNSLKHGDYRFTVRAEIQGGAASEQSYSFTVLPWFYETTWFRILFAVLLLATGWAIYQLRLRQIRYRFSLVLEERARLAREIHDTLAQGFVGISSQLDAVAMCMPEEGTPARKFLDLARRMARHSLTEARRAVMDLRSAALEDQDLASAIQSGTRQWTAGSGVEVEVDVDGTRPKIPEEMEQHLLRIAQEAVTNVLKHAGATRIGIKLHLEARKLYLRIRDNGRGFDQNGVFSTLGGHFGLIGMRERAERLGGELRLASHPGEGTEVEVSVPLP